jgi:hypothetical protein
MHELTNTKASIAKIAKPSSKQAIDAERAFGVNLFQSSILPTPLHSHAKPQSS